MNDDKAVPVVAGGANTGEVPIDPINVSLHHPESYCHKCGGRNITWFAPNELWNTYAGDSDIICPICFAKMAEEAGCNPTAWQLSTENLSELEEIRLALAGSDISSLPSDFPTVRMAHQIRSDHDKFIWQVRDTCARAEAAEAALREFGKHDSACEYVTDDPSTHPGCDCGLAEALARTNVTTK